MVRNFASYTVEILEKPFIIEEKSEYSQTAKVTFFDEQNKELKNLELGYVDVDSIYEAIYKSQEVYLETCYVKNFSISDYKEKYSIEDDVIVNMYFFSALETFFDADTNLDFSKINFQNENVSFNNCAFLKKITFNSTIFGKGTIDFEYTLFFDGNIDFSNARFGDGDISFKNAILKSGNKKLEDIIFGKGEVSFVNVEFGDGNISFSNTDFSDGRTTFRVARFGDGKKDFNHVHFGKGEVTFEKTEFHKGEVNFRSAIFEDGKKDFTRSEFGEGEVNFVNTIFGNGNVSFTGTDFKNGKVNFKLAEFGTGFIDFHYAIFGEGDIIFERTFFGSGGVDFRAVDFGKGKISFSKAEFGIGDIVFEASTLKEGSVSFRRSIFGNGAFNFEGVQYENAELVIDDVDFGLGKVSFNRSKFNSLSLKSCQINNYIDLRVEKCKFLDLSYAIVKDIIDLRATDFKVDIENLEMTGIRLLGRIYIDWKENNVKDLIYKQKTTNRNRAEQFRALKENYHTIGMYLEEDYAYIEFKRTEAKGDLYDAIDKNKKNKFWAYPVYWFQWLIFDKMGLYATNPLRVLLSMVICYAIFSLIYFFFTITHLGSIFDGPPDAATIPLIFKCFYLSVITFFTIGFGDFYPMGYMRIIAGFEGFSGVFMMSYFTVAFVRKILR